MKDPLTGKDFMELTPEEIHNFIKANRLPPDNANRTDYYHDENGKAHYYPDYLARLDSGLEDESELRDAYGFDNEDDYSENSFP